MSNSTYSYIMLVGSVINLAILIWFITTLNKICATIIRSEKIMEEVATYTRRSALATQLTQKQAKVLNKAYSIEELVNSLEKNGAKLNLLKFTYAEGMPAVFELNIENASVADPEWSKQLMEQEDEAIKFLRIRMSENS